VREVGVGLRSRRRRRKTGELPSHMTKVLIENSAGGSKGWEVVTDAKGNYLMHPTLHYRRFPLGNSGT
jgi:hypothetical protein